MTSHGLNPAASQPCSLVHMCMMRQCCSLPSGCHEKHDWGDGCLLKSAADSGIAATCVGHFLPALHYMPCTPARQLPIRVGLLSKCCRAAASLGTLQLLTVLACRCSFDAAVQPCVYHNGFWPVPFPLSTLPLLLQLAWIIVARAVAPTCSAAAAATQRDHLAPACSWPSSSWRWPCAAPSGR